MKTKIITVQELIAQERDIDVIDDIDESVYVAMVGPVRLTQAGEEHFRQLMPVKVEICEDAAGQADMAVILIDGSCGEGQEEREATLLKLAYELFWGAAGYCSQEQYAAWFREEGAHGEA